jgi:hypothetical protein
MGGFCLEGSGRDLGLKIIALYTQVERDWYVDKISLINQTVILTGRVT